MSKVNEEKAPILAADASEVAPVSGLSNNQRLPVTVSRPTPYTFDLGNLTGFDSNPLPSTTDSGLAANARDGAQALINQLLTTCPISSTSSGVLLSLPPTSTPLPREKPLPVAKPPTKWQQFALKKGIKDKKKEGKLVYDEGTGDWVPKWGYKGANKKGEDDWLVEVDEEKERAREAKLGDGRGNTRALPRRERLESVRRNERKMRANDRKSRKTAT